MNKVLVSPIVYAGGKRWLFSTFMEYFPDGTKEVVSPFFGGGCIEINLAARGVKVNGYDLFEPVVNFWKQFIEHPDEIVKEALFLLATEDREFFAEIKDGRYFELEDNAVKAILYLIINRMSFGGMTFRSSNLRSDAKKGLNAPYLSSFAYYQFTGLSVSRLHFSDSLAIHNDVFAYCDPPYAHLQSGLYGNSEIYHELFDHECLFDILKNRDNWILSYNDVESIRYLYSDFHQIAVIRKSDGRIKKNEELLILSPDVWEHYQNQPKQLDLDC